MPAVCPQARRSSLMTRHIHRIAALATAGLAVAGLAACSSNPNSGGTGGGNSSSGAPVKGGTLRIVAASGPDHLDTVPAYYTADYIMERAYARQLLTYPTVPDPTFSSPGWKKDITPVPDIATAVPTTANGGITNGGKTYTFHIKPGVDWNTTPSPPGHLAGLRARVQGVLQPGQPGRQPRLLQRDHRRPDPVLQRRDRVLRQEVEQADRGEHRRASRTRTTSPASSRRTLPRSSST